VEDKNHNTPLLALDKSKRINHGKQAETGRTSPRRGCPAAPAPPPNTTRSRKFGSWEQRLNPGRGTGRATGRYNEEQITGLRGQNGPCNTTQGFSRSKNRERILPPLKDQHVGHESQHTRERDLKPSSCTTKKSATHEELIHAASYRERTERIQRGTREESWR
jgi:hypothetical protein